MQLGCFVARGNGSEVMSKFSAKRYKNGFISFVFIIPYKRPKVKFRIIWPTKRMHCINWFAFDCRKNLLFWSKERPQVTVYLPLESANTLCNFPTYH